MFQLLDELTLYQGKLKGSVAVIIASWQVRSL